MAQQLTNLDQHRERKKRKTPASPALIPTDNDATRLASLSQSEWKSSRSTSSPSPVKGQLLRMRTRTPYIGEIVPFDSPEDAEVTFGIKRLDNRAVMAFRDKNSVVRFIFSNDEDGSDKYAQEKDYPQGTMRVDTVALGLDSWNIIDDNGKPIPVDRDTILTYLSPGELDAVYEKVLEVNPILTGQAATKKD